MLNKSVRIFYLDTSKSYCCGENIYEEREVTKEILIFLIFPYTQLDAGMSYVVLYDKFYFWPSRKNAFEADRVKSAHLLKVIPQYPEDVCIMNMKLQLLETISTVCPTSHKRKGKGRRSVEIGFLTFLHGLHNDLFIGTEV